MASINDLAQKYQQAFMSPLQNMSVGQPTQIPQAPVPSAQPQQYRAPAPIQTAQAQAPAAAPSFVDQEAINNYMNTNAIAQRMGLSQPAPQTQQPAAQPQASQNIFDIYGMSQSQQPQGNLFDLYGVEQPTKEKADTSKYDAEIEKYRPTDNTQQIQEMLSRQLQDISKRYEIQREDTKRQTASEFQSQLSGLYNAGVVNPLSSGTGSIDAASDATLDRRLAAINTAENAEKSLAEATAFKMKTDAQEKALDFAMGERKRLEAQTQEEYDYERQQMSDKVDLVNNVVNAWKVGQTLDREKRLDAQKNVMDIVSTFGSGAFEGMDANKIGEIEKATGYAPGALFKGIQSLKQQELLDAQQDMELRTIDGSLYNIYRDKNGAVKSEMIIKGKTSGGSGKAPTQTQKFDAWLTKKEDLDRVQYNIADPIVLKSLISQYELGSSLEKEFGVGGTKKEKYTYSNLIIDGIKYEVKKDSTGKIVEKIPLSGSSTVDGDISDEEVAKFLGE